MEVVGSWPISFLAKAWSITAGTDSRAFFAPADDPSVGFDADDIRVGFGELGL